MTKLLLRVDEAAQVLSISRATAYELVRAGAMPGIVRLGGRSIRISLAALEAAINEEAAAGQGDGSQRPSSPDVSARG